MIASSRCSTRSASRSSLSAVAVAPFLMTLAEFPDPAHPARVIAIATKAWVRDRLRELTDELSADTTATDPAALADRLAVVMEGVYASVQALGADGPALQARVLAEILIHVATG